MNIISRLRKPLFLVVSKEGWLRLFIAANGSYYRVAATLKPKRVEISIKIHFVSAIRRLVCWPESNPNYSPPITQPLCSSGNACIINLKPSDRHSKRIDRPKRSCIWYPFAIIAFRWLIPSYIIHAARVCVRTSNNFNAESRKTIIIIII